MFVIVSGMIKKCIWKSKRISCSAIFSMHPTDRGMCCSFNKQKADMMFKESRYQEQNVRMNDQDKMHSFEDSGVPDWWAQFVFAFSYLTVRHVFQCNRYDPFPESGWSRGLTLVLDAHTDQITASSIPHYFQALNMKYPECKKIIPLFQ